MSKRKFNLKNITIMKKIMTLAIIALASVAMVSCCGQPKKAACCDKPATECATCPQAAECPQAAPAETPAPEAAPEAAPVQ